METDVEAFNRIAAEDKGTTPPVSETPQAEAQPASTPAAEVPAEAQAQPATPEFELNPEASVAPEKTGTAFDFDTEFKKRFNGKDVNAFNQELSELEVWKKKAGAESYRSPVGKSFDELVAPVEKGGKGVPPEIALRYLSDTSKMPEKEYKTLMMKIDRPDLTDSEIGELIDMDYKLGKYAGFGEDDDDTVRKEKERPGMLKMKYDVGELRKKESEIKAKMLAPFETRGQIDVQENQKKAEQIEAKRKEDWKPTTKKLLEEFKSFKIPIGEKVIGQNGSTSKVPVGFYNFKVSDEVRAKIEADVTKVVDAQSSLMPDDAGQKWVKDKILQWALLEHQLPQIADTLVKFGISQKNGEISKELHNPNFSQQQVDTGVATSDKDVYDWIKENVK